VVLFDGEAAVGRFLDVLLLLGDLELLLVVAHVVATGPRPVVTSHGTQSAPAAGRSCRRYTGVCPYRNGRGPGSRISRLDGAAAAQLDQAVAHDLLQLGLKAEDEGQLLVGVLGRGGAPGLDHGREDRGDVAQAAGRGEGPDPPATA